MPTITGYQIFDSMDQPMSRIVPCSCDLYDTLDRLQREGDEVPYGPTYAIAAHLSDGNITFDI